MRLTFLVWAAVLVAPVFASDIIDIRSETALIHPDRIAWSERRYPEVTIGLARAAQEACPTGFEKVREYAAPEGPNGDWHVHFVVRCITPASTPVASAPAAPR